MGASYRRKLAVILHADVVDSTGLVHRDESIAHERIQSAFHRLSETIDAYGGVCHEIRGDAVLAEFPRASDALSASLSFQAQNTEFNQTLADTIHPKIRIGISLGEVIISDRTLTGPDVVLAQRVEQLAQPNGICVTAAMQQAVPKRLPFEFKGLGNQKIKGFEDTVRVFAVALTTGYSIPGPEPPERAAIFSRIKVNRLGMLAIGLISIVAIAALVGWGLSRYQRPDVTSIDAVSLMPSNQISIAVLPFDNMSNDPDQEYFVDGMTDDLITDLSKIAGIYVVARNTVFAYKNKRVSVQDIGRDLGVGYVLDGSVRRAGDVLRVNAQLVEVSSKRHMWAERYDRSFEAIFTLQDEITQSVYSALAVQLSDDDEMRLIDRTETLPEAYDMLLRGLAHVRRFTPENNVEARAFFHKAIELDPGYARAHADVAFTHGLDLELGWTTSRRVSSERGFEFARRALTLDESRHQTHFALALLHLGQRSYDDAIIAARRTIELDPNNADGHALLANILDYAGQSTQALKAIEAALRFNPRSPFFYLTILGSCYFAQARYEDAIDKFQQAIERNPNFSRARLQLAAAYAHAGRVEDAAWEVEEILTLSPTASLSNERESFPYQRSVDLERYLDGLRIAGLPD